MKFRYIRRVTNFWIGTLGKLNLSRPNDFSAMLPNGPFRLGLVFQTDRARKILPNEDGRLLVWGGASQRHFAVPEALYDTK